MNPENSPPQPLPTVVPQPEDAKSQPQLPVTPPPIEEIKHYRYGGFITRYIATVIDSIIIFIILGIIGLVMSLFAGKGNTPTSAILNFLQVLLYLASPAYAVYFLHKHGATPGKKALHLKVVALNHEPLGIGQVLMREVVGKMLSGFFGSLGYFWYLFDEHRQAWHDKIAHTIVIDTRDISEEQYNLWKSKQKSDLPLFLILSALTPLLFLLIVFGMTLIPQYRLYVLPAFPLATTLVTVLMIVLGVNIIACASTGIVLLKKRKDSPFLTGTPTKVGIGIYLFFQIFLAFMVVVLLIAGTIFMLSKAATPQNLKTYQNASDQYNSYDTRIPTLTPAPFDVFTLTYKSLPTILGSTGWTIEDTTELQATNPTNKNQTISISGTQRGTSATSATTTEKQELLTYTLKINSQLLTSGWTEMPIGIQQDPKTVSNQFYKDSGGKRRIVRTDYLLTGTTGNLCPCKYLYVIFYSDPFSLSSLNGLATPTPRSL